SAAQIFNGLRQTLPMTSPVKTTEDEHCNKFLNVYINNVFTAQKRYEVKFNCSLLESMQRPDFLCTIDDVPFLISEIKPLGTSPLLKKNDFKKAHLRAKDAVNQQLNKKYGPGKVVLLINAGNSLKSFIMDQYNGMYRSWGYMTTKLATDIPEYDNIRFEEAVKLLSQFRENLLDSPNSNPPNFLIFKTALRLSRVNLKKLGHINQYIELIKNNPKELGESLGTVIWHSRPEIREKKKELEDPQNLDQYFNGFPIYI
ncbi:21182_t:CDS:2, partial [Entrophospora sp. SA101]